MTAEASRAPLDAASLRARIAGTSWRRLDVVEETGSTNADLVARAAGGEDIGGAVLVAEHQASGRGRGGRVWSGVPMASITMSVGVSAAGVDEQNWALLPLLTGVAVVQALADAGVAASLKWPNDVLVDGAKIAGILAEVASPQPVVVVGIGLNVTVGADEIDQPGATSVLAAGGDTDREALVLAMLGHLGARIADWRAGRDLLTDYRRHSATIGARVRALLPGDREFVGTATGVDDRGQLTIESAGTAMTVAAGDIVHLRPAPEQSGQ
ncbi:biotin--[acetyl-CoA-carboxylase] ligase [Mycolicibacterium diernhoferi]|uniref:biotin--[biotin carboxyl-carrier protein] ligase n=1 Tax=Mycolicibacterium diernhoferi TaxID=1801 RepID=A0A1Q4H9Y1_9MYCO|nr:biotin--[acetyl-CoA-carboxylase] ligase [Mycolicibacterium diernhoferi]OJZ64360.1 biotin--[acetyl-CoA-carboxylase] ligase [Mycolicibacterium diernhoferi]OPE49465.1 biotin--[acetyl-CoA-carboxylase] ligase [Mycolicibacterium diernhoferi]PEG53440.1 biotin--[acetyl-CoA-carboxylase] ligase [Mycolicibacterium diernhoferi]QYL24179.1 biotin--[acetyl-CoA-carboxylase] ligase [Mycolicibacterium diernhoferi]